MIDHFARPGPGYWDWRCLRCGDPCDWHPTRLRVWWRRMRAYWA
jgi:hypothetical protein